MAKSKVLVTLIREIVRQEVKKEVSSIFIKEGVKAVAQNNSVPEVLPKPTPKRSKSAQVSYTKNPTLNKILNETAQAQEFEEYPSMGEFDTSNMADMLGYGNMMGDAESQRKAAAVSTAQAVGADTSNPAVQGVMNNLTKDYRGVMKALDKKDGKV
jgi:hypothetical protein